MRGDASRRPRGGLLEAGSLGELPPAGSKSRRVVRHTHGALRSRRNRMYTTWKLRGDRAQAAALPSPPHAPGQILSNRGCHMRAAVHPRACLERFCIPALLAGPCCSEASGDGRCALATSS